MTRDMAEDKKISDAVQLLLKGGKMLGFHCNSCDTPLFEMEEDIFCPHCKKRYRIVEIDGKKAVEPVESVSSQTESHNETYTAQKFENYEKLSEKVEVLFDRIASRALDSDNIHEIRELVKLLRELAEILKKLRE